MTEEQKVSLLALMLGDIEGGPYYPMFTEAQYLQFLTLGNGDVNKSVVFAAISAGYFVAGEGTREVIGELQISRTTATNYLKLLEHLTSVVNKIPPSNLMPWFGNTSGTNKLLDFDVCDCSYDTFSNCWQRA